MGIIIIVPNPPHNPPWGNPPNPLKSETKTLYCELYIHTIRSFFVALPQGIRVSPQCSSDYLKNSENGKIAPSRSE